MVGFSSHDMTKQAADKCFQGIASLDGPNCGRLFAMVGVLTQLRCILSRNERQKVMEALSIFPDRMKPLGASATWWVTTTAEVAARDFWLVTSAVNHGVRGAMDAADASAIGALRGTLRQSSVSTVDVESRLEQLAHFLVSHFESASRTRVAEERAAALSALLR